MCKVWGKVSQECTVILEMLNFLRTVYRINRLKEAPVPKTSSIRLVVSIQCRLVTDRRTDGHTTTAYTALA